MSDSIPDNGAPNAFVFPASPQDAVLRLAIMVEAGEGDSLVLSAQLTPGFQTWGHQAVEGIFRQARVVPLEGTYVLETSVDGTRVVSAPEGVDETDRRSIVFVWEVNSDLDVYLIQLVAALQAFPSANTITQAAHQVIGQISIGSFERGMLFFYNTPVVDARTVEVEAVDCIVCGFGPQSILALLLRAHGNAAVDDGTTTVDGLKFAIKVHNGAPVVKVGYLDHDSVFAAFLNNALAERVRTTIRAVAHEVVAEMLFSILVKSRLCERAVEAIQATYQVDLAVVTARVDALEAEAHARFTPPLEADVDRIDQDFDEPADESADGDTGDGPDPDEPAPQSVS